MKEITNIKIKGVTGIRHISMFDRMDGKHDAKNNQICKVDEGLTTPRIIRKCRSCDQFTNQLYIMAVEELKTLYTDIAVSIKELSLMTDEQETAPAVTGMNPATEEGMRQAAARAAKAKAYENRKTGLMIHLAELEQNCRNIDETLKHNLDRAGSTLREHVESYWSGVLQGAAGEILPVSPALIEENLSGKAEYAEQYERVMELLERNH